MRKYFILFGFVLSILFASAEGTKQLVPCDGGGAGCGKSYLQINDVVGTRPFALTTNANPLHRLHISIATAGEIINFGFKGKTTLNAGEEIQYRIKDPAGNIVVPLTNVATAGAGFIANYTEATIGPNTLTGGAGGYTPQTYTTLTTGDYYIEFQRIDAGVVVTSPTTPTSKFLFDFFDITVSNGVTPIQGRVWSNAWDLTTNGGDTESNSVFYVYTTDRYITKVDLNGMKPFGFVVACNSFGSVNTGDLFNDRKSISSTSTVVPEYKIFLNSPDPAMYPVATPPTMTEDLSASGVVGPPEKVEFYVNMTTGGVLEIFLDLDGVPGYQAGDRDVVLVKNIAAGGDVIEWDCKDLQGNRVNDIITVSVDSRFATGVTHFPIYDAEKNQNGILATRTAPDGPEDLILYWDDSNVTYGGDLPTYQRIVAIDTNSITNGHRWDITTGTGGSTNGFGNNNTMNTWWNGYEIANLRSFTFTLDDLGLPIELENFDVIQNGSNIHIIWSTLSETNNEYFEIEQSFNGIDWERIALVNGAHTSTSRNIYSYNAPLPKNEISYYRLKQIDFDGRFSYSEIKSIKSNINTINQNSVYCDPINGLIIIKELEYNPQKITITSAVGQIITPTFWKTGNNLNIKTSNLSKGIYFIHIDNSCLPIQIHK